MVKFVNRAKMTTSTTGTGTLTLVTALSGFQSFAASGVVNADIVTYVIEDGTAWEIGNGVYTSVGTTLSRSLLSSSTGSLLVLTGNAVVYVSVISQTIDDLYATKADLASPTFTGTPLVPTATVGTNTTQIATTAFVNAEIANDAPTKTGTGASGTWGISITGDAASTDGKSFGTFTAAGGIAYATSTTALAAIAAGTSGQVLLSGGAGAPTWGGVIDYQAFTASGTWTKPAGISANSIVFVRMWAGGGGGHPTSFNGGGGGGGYGELWLKASDLGATETVTVGGGGAAGAAGGNTTFDSRTVFGGGAGLATPGGAGGNSFSQSPQAGSGSPSAVSFLGGAGSSAVLGYGGAGEFWGGGAGGHDQGDGGQAIWGGGGGAGGTGGALGGVSTFGGTGGNPNGAGSAPAGGGGGGATAGAGARGEVRVWTIG